MLCLAGAIILYLKFHKITPQYSVIDKTSIYLFDKNSYGINYVNVKKPDINIYWYSESNPQKVLINTNGRFINRIKNDYGKRKEQSSI